MQNQIIPESASTAARISPVAENGTRKFWGLFTHRPRWGLSRGGWLCLALALLLAGGVLFIGIYPFLAVTQRLDANILVVEGWIHPYAARAAVKEFNTGGYKQVFTTGGPVTGSGGYINDQNTSASVGAYLLKSNGMPPQFIQMVPSHVNSRDRTYSSAVALRDWVEQHHIQVTRMNLMTEHLHARRSRLLFQEALGPQIEVGIIAVPDPDYDAKYWWRYSEGVRDVVGETVAYIYARFFFMPKHS